MLTGRRALALIIFFSFCCIFPVAGGSLGAETGGAPAKTGQIEATVVHVDQYAVYAPNLVFYFDQSDKRKVGAITRAAEHLRNRKALITYNSVGGNRMVILDLVPASEKGGAEKAAREPAETAQKQAPTGTPPVAQDQPAAKPPAGPVHAVTVPNTAGSGEPAPVQRGPATRATDAAVHQGANAPASQAASEPSQTIGREELTAFVRQLLDLNGKKDIGTVMPFYADKVDYYDRGVVDRDYVKRDLGYYFRNWDTISTSLDGDVVVIVLEPGVRIVKFKTAYAVSNSRKTLAGKTENIWKIQKINGRLRLIDVKQRVIGRGE